LGIELFAKGPVAVAPALLRPKGADKDPYLTLRVSARTRAGEDAHC